jgi:hypothetical protein
VIRKRRSKKRGPVRSKKVMHDGINFASGLEKHMYIVLKKARIKAAYEGETFILVDGFMFESSAYERQANGKKDMADRGNKKILPIKYTPDFIGDDFIIETKGRANESFPMRWKLFKKYINEHRKGTTLYKPQNQKECDKVIELIKEKRKCKTKQTGK